jgi:hypothetical protein
VAALTAAHEAAMGGQRAYYSKVTLANLDLIRTLKVTPDSEVLCLLSKWACVRGRGRARAGYGGWVQAWKHGAPLASGTRPGKHFSLNPAFVCIAATLAQEEIAGMRAAEAQRERLVGDVVRENRALTEPLGKVG